MAWAFVVVALLALAVPAWSQTYRIGAGDVLEVQIAGEPELSVPAPGLAVGPDGRIVLPFAGEVQAAGSTCEEVATRIRQALIDKQVLLDPDVMVRVREYHSQVYNVLGAVRAPGVFPFRPNTTIRDALAQAGGLVEIGEGAASQTQARLIRTDGHSIPIPLAEVLGGTGDFAALAIEPGDTLVVDRRGTIAVIGRVVTPGVVEVDGPVHLSEVLARRGGVPDTGDADRVSIRRLDGTVEEAGVFTGRQGALPDPLIQPGDTVIVPDVQYASVIGYVMSPGRYAVRATTRVSDIIAQAGGPAGGVRTFGGGAEQRGDLSRVTLTRSEGVSLNLDIARVLLHGGRMPENDPLVRAGDTVFVPEERLEVVVLGHVATPGRYSFRQGDRISDALALAGGPLRPTTVPTTDSGADLSRCVLHRVSGETISLDMTRILGSTGSADNLALEQGDTLFVPESDNRVVVAGYVTTPGYYAFRAGDTIRTALAMAGGVLTNVGSPKTVEIQHADGSAETVDATANDQVLRGGDMLTVPFGRLRVAVLGYVTAPGVFEWHAGDTVVDMLAQAGGPVLATGDVYHAVLIRRTKPAATPREKPAEVLAWVGDHPPDASRTTRGEYEVVDLGRLYDKGQLAGNPLVEPEDIIFVPRSDHTNYSSWLGNIEHGLVIWNLLRGIF